ncbi:MAG: hypothetical protein OEW75_09035 [Cyclobacteriaceae bacterium]|nr:hypothetical protein [Cyclobacteriaceae bacterium]
MNKKKFIHLVHNAEKANDEDLKLLDKLQADYPYSQIIHALAAKSHIINNSSEAQKKLGHAAIYSTDRSILKKYIQKTGILQPVTEEAPTTPKPTTPVESKVTVQKQVTKVISIESIQTSVSSEHDREMEILRKEIIENAFELQRNIKQFHDQDEIEQNERESTLDVPVDKIQEPEALNNIKNNVNPDAPAQQKESDKNELLTEKSITEEKNNLEENQDFNSSSNENLPEKDVEIISEIEKKEEKQLGPKQEEQNEVIKNFITLNPKIKPPKEDLKDIDAETQDLARESVSFKDDLISENLAVIMAQQGKKTKAIEIYKKLIWKYPQKKTYFAAQIKNLEN